MQDLTPGPLARVVSGGGGDGYVGMDLSDPEIDFIGLSKSLGVEARSAAGTEELTEAVSEALSSGAPTLIDAAVAGTRDSDSVKAAAHYSADE
jgi:benzoylformate decarboxylase